MACEDESDDCQTARSDYESANEDFLNAHSDIREASDKRNVALGVVAIGVAVAVVPNPATGVGLFLGVGGALVSAFYQGRVSRARERCRDALSRLLDAYSRAADSCRDPDCVPEQPSDGCS
jgi:hypothetical protein